MKKLLTKIGSKDKPEKTSPKLSAKNGEDTKENTAGKSEPSQNGEDWGVDLKLFTATSKVGKDDFELLNVIGKGSFAKVMQVRKKDDGKIYAMKILRKEAVIARNEVNHTKAEKRILQKVSHPFIVGLHYAFQTEDKLYMVLDFVNGGELFYHLKKEGRFPENRVKFYVAQLVSALAHLHSLNIVYRDLKPENILLDADGYIRITDFGLSKEMQRDESTNTFCGTPEYISPELLKGTGHSFAVDWWSLGTLMYEMLVGLPPFYSENTNIMYQKILTSELQFPSFVSKEAQSLLCGLLTRDPEKRLGSSERGSDNIKSHAFFTGIDWAKLDRKEYEAPFKPNVKDHLDISNIDPTFTEEKPQDSLVERTGLVDENNFKDFTYEAPSVLDNKR